MKKKILAALSAAAVLCGCLTAPVSAAEAKDYQLGDVNMDGRVDLTDAQITLIEYVEFNTYGTHRFTDEQMKLADVVDVGISSYPFRDNPTSSITLSDSPKYTRT